MNPLYYGDNDDKNFYQGLEKLNDRELQERQALYLNKIQKSNERIKLNIQFWFYATIIIAALSIFILSK